ncbi:hypothetical protein [Knoellia koreensis]
MATPADWTPGQEVILGLAVKDEDARFAYPDTARSSRNRG